MTTTQMECFLEAARCGSFTTASEHLYITQPALSKQISNLELQLGVSLFTRGNNSVELTSIGQVLYAEMAAVYAQYKDMLNTVDRLKTGASGQLNIGVMEDQLLPEKLLLAIQSFLAQYPNVRISLSHMNLRDLHNGLLNHELDFTVEIADYEKHVRDFEFVQLEIDPEYLYLPASANVHEEDIALNQDYTKLNISLPLLVLDRDNYEPPVQKQLKEITDDILPDMTYISSIGAIPLLVTAGLGYTIANRTYTLRDDPHVVHYRTNGSRMISKGMFWNKGNKNPMIQALLDTLESTTLE